MPGIAPPTVPMTIDPLVREYLQRFSAWVANELFTTVSTNSAVPKLMFLASDEKPPKHAFMVTVDSAGAMSITSVPLGSTPT